MAGDPTHLFEDLDETQFSIAEYLPDSMLPQCPLHEPVHSFDFDEYGGIPAPRDGFQRPLLFSEAPPPAPPVTAAADPRIRLCM